jgi:hypothetical protein
MAKRKKATKAMKQQAPKQQAAKGTRARPTGQFREGSARAKVWAALRPKLAGGKPVKMADVTKAVQTALKLSADAAAKQGGLFLWTFVRAGLVTRAAKGEFAAVTKG